MHFKKITALCASFILASSICASAKTLEFTMGNNTMYESTGVIEAHTLENAPYTKNDRTMVPVRIISERFNAEVGWDGEKNQVSIVKGDKNIILTLGSDIAVVNGEEIKLDVAPEEFNGRTMVPLRFISETLEMNVKYIASTQQVIISDDEALLTINGKDITIEDYRSLMVHFARMNPSVSTITELLSDVYSASPSILEEGSFVLDSSADNVLYQLANSGVDYYAENALVAPIAEIIEHNNIIMEKALNEIEANDGDALILEKYKKNYVTAKHILILADETNHVEAKMLAEAVLKEAKSGKDFDELIDKYNEDPGLLYYPDGYTFTYGEMIEPFEKASFELKEGEISALVETPYGYHIIKKEPLAPIDDETYNIFLTELVEELYNAYCDEGVKKAEITVHKTDAEIAELLK